MSTESQLKDQLTALNKIVKNTGAAAKAIAGERQTGNFTGGGNDKLEKSSRGVLEGFKDLITHSDRLREAQEKLTKSNEDYLDNNKETVDQISSLSKAYELQRASSQSVSMANKNLKEFVDSLGKDLVDHGYGVNDLSKEIGKAGGDFKKIQKVLDGFSDSLKESIKVNNENVKKIEGEGGIFSTLVGAAKAAFTISNPVVAMMLAAGTALTIQWSNLSLRSQELGLELGGVKGTVDLGRLAVGIGASLGDTQRFIAGNRDIITALTSQATVTANAGLKAISSYGDVVRDTFGAIGIDQLELVGKGMKAITNFGQEISPEAFGKFTQGIEDMQRTSNLSAKELFSEFADLSEMEGMQSLMLTLGEGAEVTTLLSESFLTLQKAVGMNATEFIKHRRRLAEDTKRSGTDRVTQGAFVARLAKDIGGFSDQQVELMRRATSFRESLDPEDRKKADVLLTQLSMRTSELQNKAAENQNYATFEFLRIMVEGGNLQEKQGLLVRGQAKITEKVVAAQAKALEESRKGIDPITRTNVQIQEFIRGIIAGGPIGIGAGGIDVITAIGDFIAETEGTPSQIKKITNQILHELLPYMGDLALELAGDVKETVEKTPIKDFLNSTGVAFEAITGFGGITFSAGVEIGKFITSLLKNEEKIIDFTEAKLDLPGGGMISKIQNELYTYLKEQNIIATKLSESIEIKAETFYNTLIGLMEEGNKVRNKLTALVGEETTTIPTFGPQQQSPNENFTKNSNR